MTPLHKTYTIAAIIAMAITTQSQAYVPPLFGLKAPPTWYRTLHVYGGPYYGTHHWYACNEIRVGEAGSLRTPYFWAANGSDLKFSAPNSITIPLGDSVRINPQADVTCIIEPVECRPAFRLSQPTLRDGAFR